MILIADSGATKTDWCLINNGKCSPVFETLGLNPTYVSSPIISDEIASAAKHFGNASAVEKVFFYGAGCADEQKRNEMKSELFRCFQNAEIEVYTDLFGACRAVCGDKDGIVGILGTGSNSCVYKNGKIVANIPSAGYMLGDEGSGTYIGKMLLKKYLTKRMPSDIEEKFSEFIGGLSRNEILNIVYHQPQPNKFFASLAPFAIKNRRYTYIYFHVEHCLDDFFTNQIRHYFEHDINDLYFVGSVAAKLENQLKECAEKHGYTLRKVLQKPIKGLADFHAKK
ncbi:MAG: ATPase [Bacteroidales bacterium]|nr:ATPase [Bacteroidales bacterium]